MDYNLSLGSIGATKSQESALNKRGINNILRLLSFFPKKYIDNSVETGIDGLVTGSHAVIVGRFNYCYQDKSAAGMYYIKCGITDRKSGKEVTCIYFRQTYLLNIFKYYKEHEVVVSGTFSINTRGEYSIVSPEVLTTDIRKGMGIIPVYRNIKRLSNESLIDLIEKAFVRMADLQNPVIDRDAMANGLVSYVQALSMIHHPSSMEDIKEAKKRLLYNDLFYMAARFAVLSRHNKSDGIRVDDTSFCDEMIASLPYTLTPDQASTFDAIRSDMINGRHFKALVQGDVSCGKTDIAFLSVYMAVGGGYQAAILAPTQILAEQHFEKLKKRLDGRNIEVVLIAGKYSKNDAKKLADGTAQIAVGTHALLSDKITFNRLGLIVIDEEHRFGVEQRSAMENKAVDIDCISMTATPIPRSLAKAVLGNDVKVYSIKTMPGGRKPVKTCCDNGNHIISFTKRILALGQQVYAVCPMIDESDSDSESMKDVMNVHKAAGIYRKYLGPSVNVGELTGEQTQEEIDAVLEAFRSGKIQVLVSTTVVEVGVDVPNATLMVIHNAERFGLASMHQLRGRVGRGSAQSYCMLVSTQSPEENGRLKTLCDTTDGFKISEEDLINLRHSGNLFGQEQSGSNVYVSEIMRYDKLYERICQIAEGCPTKDLSYIAEYLELADIPKIHNMYEIDCTPC